MADDDVSSWYARVGTERTERLTSAQQGLLSICQWREEVNAGGFELYFSTLAGNSAPTAIASLPGLLGMDWASLLAEAMAQLGTDYPADPDRRAASAVVPGVAAALSELDERFYDLEAGTDADARLGSYLAEHPELQA